MSDTITLVKNSRGCWDLDTSKGCASGMSHNKSGCYGDCYAFRALNRHGYDFSKTVLRGFENGKHEQETIERINLIDMPFVRIGVTGDPSECWEHTLNVCDKVARCNMVLYSTYMKVIVIITKHWNNLTDSQLKRVAKLPLCINTSISALDKPHLRRNRLKQYNRLKKYCKSVLRVVSCDFNGKKFNLIQDSLFDNERVLDTILRVSLKNEYVTSGLINVEKVKFLGSSCYASIRNESTYFGECSTCPEMCGLNL